MQLTPEKRRALSERSEFARRRSRQTARAPEGPRHGQHGFGSFCRNKRASAAGPRPGITENHLDSVYWATTFNVFHLPTTFKKFSRWILDKKFRNDHVKTLCIPHHGLPDASTAVPASKRRRCSKINFRRNNPPGSSGIRRSHCCSACSDFCSSLASSDCEAAVCCC